MSIVGITGGFGTGKSFVARLFKKMGAKVIDADRLAHRTLKKGTATYKKIVSVFGTSILYAGGSINRKMLGKIVFSDKKKIARLNGIIHPVVISQIKERLGKGGNDIIVVDAPLLCETSLSGLMDVMVVVRSSKDTQILRCMKKFDMEKEDVCRRMACQMPIKVKVGKADYVVDNNGTRKETLRQVTKIWQELKKGATVWR